MKNKKAVKLLGIVLAGVLMSGCTINLPQTVPAETASTKEEVSAVADSSEVKEETSSVTEETQISSQGETAQNVQTDLKAKLVEQQNVDEKAIVYFNQDDYDGDGKEEAFALIGEEEDEYGEQTLVNGDVWFVSESECKRLTETMAMGFNESSNVMTMGTTNYVLFNEVFVTSLLTHAWSVENGKAVEAPFSKVGSILTGYDGENRFRIVDSSYDCTLDDTGMMTGHTWKSYYFFYNPETDEINEYGGTDVDSDAAEGLCGIDIIEKYLPKGDQADSLYIRGNGLLILNYEHKNGEFTEFYHYIYDFDKGYLVDDAREETDENPLPGVCRKALCPELAVYPQIEGPNGNVYED